MIYVPNVHKEIVVKKGECETNMIFDLHSTFAQPISGNVLLGIDDKYPYIINVKEFKKPEEIAGSLFSAPKINVDIADGLAYMTLSEVAEFSEDPYKFCVENGIIKEEENNA